MRPAAATTAHDSQPELCSVDTIPRARCQCQLLLHTVCHWATVAAIESLSACAVPRSGTRATIFSTSNRSEEESIGTERTSLTPFVPMAPKSFGTSCTTRQTRAARTGQNRRRIWPGGAKHGGGGRIPQRGNVFCSTLPWPRGEPASPKMHRARTCESSERVDAVRCRAVAPFRTDCRMRVPTSGGYARVPLLR